MDELKDENCLTQNTELTISSSSGSDEWDSDEEERKVIEYQPLAQDPVENGDSFDVNNCSDDDGDEVKSKNITQQDSGPTMDEGD